jgi:hypothetical protein
MKDRELPSLRDAFSGLVTPSREVESFCRALTGDKASVRGGARRIIEDVQSIRRLVDQVFWLEADDGHWHPGRKSMGGQRG